MDFSIKNLGVLLILTAIIPMGLSITQYPYPINILSPNSTLLTREINMSEASNVSMIVSMQDGKNCTINSNLMSNTSQDYVFEKNMTFAHGSTVLLIKCTDEWSRTVTRQIIINNDILGPSMLLISPYGIVGSSANLIIYSGDAVNCFANDSLMAQNNPQFFSKDLAGLSNGANLFNVSCYDSFGNIAANQFIITADTLIPELSIISPQNIIYNNKMILLNISANDSHLNRTWYNWNGTDYNYTDAVNITFNENNNTLHAWAIDSAGNLNYTNVTFFADTIFPYAEILSPINKIYNTKLIDFNVSYFDDNIDSAWFDYNGSSESFFGNFTKEFLEGFNAIIFYANDSAGNVNSSSVSFIVDTFAPRLEIIAPLNQTYNNTVPFLNISAIDSNISNVWYNWNGTNYSYTMPVQINFNKSSNTVHAWAADSAGNLNYTNVTFFVILENDLVVQSLNIPGEIIANNYYNITSFIRNNRNNNVYAQILYFDNGTQIYNDSFSINGNDIAESKAQNLTFIKGTHNITVNAVVQNEFNPFDNSLTSFLESRYAIEKMNIYLMAPDEVGPNMLFDSAIFAENTLDADFFLDNYAYSSLSSFDNPISPISYLNQSFLKNSFIFFSYTLNSSLVLGNYSFWANSSIADENIGLFSNNETITVRMYKSPILSADIIVIPKISDLHDSSVIATIYNYGNETAINANATIILPSGVHLVSGENQTILLDNITEGTYKNIIWTVRGDYSGDFEIGIKVQSQNYDDIEKNTLLDKPIIAQSIVYDSIIDESENLTVRVLLNNTGANALVNVSLILSEGLSADKMFNETIIANNTLNQEVIFNISSGLAENKTFKILVTESESGYYVESLIVFSKTDISVPLIDVISPANAIYNSNIIWFNATANENITQWIINYNGTNITSAINSSLVIENGEYNLFLYAFDFSNNLGLNNSINFTVDTIAPILEIISPLNATHNNAVQLVNISAGLDSNLIWYNWDGINNETYNSEVLVNFGADGFKTLQVWANDSAGNINSSSVSFTVDTFAPDLEIISPNSAIKNNKTQLVNISVGPDYDNVWFSNGTENITYTGAALIDFIEGSNTLQVWANDSAGNVNSSSVSFTVDTIAPDLEIISPNSAIKNNASQLVNISSDGASVWYNWNGTNMTYTAPINIVFNNGSNTLHAWAADSAGNVNYASADFIINSSLIIIPPVIAPPVIPPIIAIGHAIIPSIKIISPQNISYNNPIQLLNISSNGASVWYNWNGTNYSYTSPVSINFKKGIRTLQVWAKNSAGGLNYITVSFNINSNAQANNSVFANDSLIDFSILNEVDELLTFEQRLSFEIIKSNLLKDNYNASGEYYKNSAYLLKKMNYLIFNESYLFTELSNGIRMAVNVSALKVSIDNINNTKYEITRILTNALNKTISNMTIYFELPNDSIVIQPIDFRDSKAYFTIDSLAPGESITLDYSFLTKSNNGLAVSSFEILSKETAVNPLTAFVALARDNKEITLYSLGGIIILSFAALAYLARDDLFKSLSFSGTN